MPRQKGSGKGTSDRVNFRLGEEEGAFYRSKANENGMSLSAYARELMSNGLVSERAQDIELRLRGLLHEIQAGGGGTSRVDFPDEVMLSIFTSEYLLTAIVEARDVQQLYEAQDKAAKKLKKFKGG